MALGVSLGVCLSVSNPHRDGVPIERDANTYGESDSDFLPEDDATGTDTKPRTKVTMQMELEMMPHSRARTFLEQPSLHGDDQAIGFLVDVDRDDHPALARDPALVRIFPNVDVDAAAERTQNRRDALTGPRHPGFEPDRYAQGISRPRPGFIGPTLPTTLEMERRADAIARGLRRGKGRGQDELEGFNRQLLNRLHRPMPEPALRPHFPAPCSLPRPKRR